MSKAHKRLNEVLNGYKLSLVEGKNHMKVVDASGKYITSVSASPSDPYFARQTIRALVRDGHLPESVKKLVIA